MSKETEKKLINELQTNEELKAKVKGITDPAQLLKIAVDAGYDVTVEEMIEAEKEKRAEQARNTDEKLSLDDLEAAAGGVSGNGETASDGHEMGCDVSYHWRGYSEEHNEWCNNEFYISDNKSCGSGTNDSCTIGSGKFDR